MSRVAGLLLLLSLAGTGYMIAAAMIVARFRAWPRPPAATAEPVTLLKPLHGAEPRLAANLASFLARDWPAPIQLVAGVQRPGDPARAVAATLPCPPGCTVDVVGGPSLPGANAKVANLVAMMPAATHDLLVLSDSDIVAPPAYLATIAAALAEPGVGAVTCLYRGRGDAGFWSVLGAAGLSYQFLPGVLVSLALDAGQPCMGSTIALRRETLARIGGFEAFAEVLADDHAIGAAVRGLGLKVAVPSLVVTHASAEPTLGALLRHELRWAATVRAVTPAGAFAGMIVTFPVPIALPALALWPVAGLIVLAAALAARLIVARQVDRLCGACTAPLWLLPLRDCLSLAVYLAAWFVRTVEWRGSRLGMRPEGRIVAEQAR